MVRKIAIPKNDIYSKLLIINSVINLQPKELMVLASFINANNKVINRASRKIVQKELGYRSAQAINNIINVFKKKGLIEKSGKEYVYIQLISGLGEVNSINFTFHE